LVNWEFNRQRTFVLHRRCVYSGAKNSAVTAGWRFSPLGLATAALSVQGSVAGEFSSSVDARVTFSVHNSGNTVQSPTAMVLLTTASGRYMRNSPWEFTAIHIAFLGAQHIRSLAG
jgi:hypothetical protein